MATISVHHFTIRVPISNDRLRLVPFDLETHSNAFVAQSADHPELFAHMPTNHFTNVDDFKAIFSNPESVYSLANPAHFAFAIIDKTRPPSQEDPEGELAGLISYSNASKAHLSSEIGPVIVLPKYQRTHVTSNAVGLLLQYAFSPPEEGGIGLRRMQWYCSSANAASIKAAERFGYERVGVIPYHYRFRLGRRHGKQGNGKPLPPGGDPDDLWRDTIVYSMSWDVWEDAAREKVKKAMSR